jgi:cysteinyl-tRNA synthetase
MSKPELRLYNTLTRTKEAFAPIDPLNVRMYVCGPTVYDFAHIGNARPVIVFDVLFRLLRHLYGEEHVTYVRNITDVDDKINARAARDYPGLPLNEAIRKVTEATNAQFQADVKALGCLEPTFQPRATEHIDGMKAMIERLVDLDVAYVAEGHVLFSPKRMAARVKSPRYGALARRSLDEMLAGARVDVASYKEDDMDFVLWKPSKPGEPGWPSPSGIDGLGRPGWHIECSAMSMAKLLEPFGGGLKCDDPEKNVFDIHAGGIDLVFPHHENEIAQSCCAFGTERMANIWMHNGFLQVEGRKMSKSEGNFVTINDVLRKHLRFMLFELDTMLEQSEVERRWNGLGARLAMLQTQYRNPIDWTDSRFEEARSEVIAWHETLKEIGFHEALGHKHTGELVDALSDDLNTPAAIMALRQFAKAKDYRSLGEGMDLLGLFDADLASRYDLLVDQVNAPIESRVKERLAFIAAKNWPEADRIRDELLGQGIQLKDGKDPATGERVTTWEVKR